jgi:hypothetical protein
MSLLGSFFLLQLTRRLGPEVSDVNKQTVFLVEDQHQDHCCCWLEFLLWVVEFL